MRAARILLATLAAILVLLLAAVWLVPPRLDWDRYRGTVEAIASTVLGRQVTIEGPISLSLLPEAVISADGVDVASADTTPGITLRIQALRLRVALGPLLAGRIVLRELVLRQPELHLPWPLPDRAALHEPDWFDAFSARIDDGRLSIGRLAFTGVDAALAGSDTGALSLTGTAHTQGVRTAELGWHFTARLTGPGGDGAQGLDVALDGQGREASGLGGTFSGQLAPDGTVAGRIAGRGPDLSLLLPAPRLAFKAEGRLTAAAGLAAADDLTLDLGGSPLRGAVALRVSPVERLDLALAGTRFDLDPWLPALEAGGRLAMPVGLDLSAEAAEFAGGTLRRLRAAFDLGAEAVIVREATALLPGDAALRLAGRLEGADPAHRRFEGEGKLDAPDLRATLRWLDRAGGLGLGGLPGDVLRRATLSGRLAAGVGEFAVSGLEGQVDGSPVSGAIRVRPGEHPRIDADLHLATLALDPWLPARPPPLAAWPGLFEGSLKLEATRASLLGVAIDRLAMDASSQDATLALHGLRATVQGARVTLAGTVGEGGRISGGSFSLSAADATPLAGLLPPAWRGTPALWDGPLDVQAAAAGPPRALALRVGLALADGRLDAQPVLDLASGAWSGPLALRHPGATRLLAITGLLAGADWIGQGSLSLTGEFSGAPGRLSADAFDLTAGSLRASGKLALDLAGPETGSEAALTGRVSAAALPLPVLPPDDPAPLAVQALRGWRASVAIDAAKLLAGDAVLLDHAAGHVSLDGGKLRIADLSAALSGGALHGSVLLDASAETPALAAEGAVSGLSLSGPATGLPLDIVAGHGDAAFRLAAEGHGRAALLATLSGKASLSLADGAVSGIDFSAFAAALARLAAAPDPSAEAAPRDALRDALSGGTTPFRSLTFGATVEHGVLTFSEAALAASAGTIAWSGSLALPGLSFDLAAELRPAASDLPASDLPEIGLRLTGPAGALRRTPELAGLAQWRADHPVPPDQPALSEPGP